MTGTLQATCTLPPSSWKAAMTTNNQKLAPNTIITGEHLYSDAINLVLANAKNKILIFDQDLSRGDYASLEKFKLLQKFLTANIASHLTIILQDATFFQEKCPRLFNLLIIHGHKMSVHVTNASVKHVKECFILADGRHYVKRMHIDQARFKYALDDPQSVEILNNRFQELQDAIDDVVTTRPLGL